MSAFLLLLLLYFFPAILPTQFKGAGTQSPVSSITPPVEQMVIPKVESAVSLLEGDWAWSAPRPILDKLAAGNLDQLTTAGGNLDSAAQEFGSAWKNGLLVYEPTFIGTSVEGSIIKMLVENVNMNPTFSRYNSLMIPEKKPFLGPFYIPGMSRQLYFGSNPALTSQIGKFDTAYPWSLGERGLQWWAQGLSAEAMESVGSARLLIIVKASKELGEKVLKTKEGSLVNDYDKEYKLQAYPAQHLAEILFIDKPMRILATRLNEDLFTKESTRRAKVLLNDENLTIILDNKPPNDFEIPKVFQIKPITE